MHLLTPHEGRMPSPDEYQSKSQLTAEIGPASKSSNDKSFLDTFADLPALNEIEKAEHNNLEQAQLSLALEHDQTNISTEDVSAEGLGYNRLSEDLALSQTSKLSEANELKSINIDGDAKPGDKKSEIPTTTATNRDSINATKHIQNADIAITSAPSVQPLPVNGNAELTHEPSLSSNSPRHIQELSHAEQQAASKNMSTENSRGYIKTQINSRLPAEDNLTLIAVKLESADGQFQNYIKTQSGQPVPTLINPAHPSSQIQHSEDNVSHYIKTHVASPASNQLDITQVQRLVDSLENDGSSSFKTLAPTNQLIAAAAPTLHSSALVQTQTPLQVLTVPIQNISQNIVQAVLKQESTLIRIDPPELGRIQLDFDHSTSGKTTITLSTETESAKLMLLERRAFMIGLFESHGLDDVEIKLDSNLEKDENSSDRQLFSDRDKSSNFEDKSESLASVSKAENKPENTIKTTIISGHQPDTNRLHIRV